MRRALALALLLMALLATPALSEMDGDAVYTLLGPDGEALTMRAGRMFEGDEYIAGDDGWYRIASVDDAARTATAEYLGQASVDGAALSAFAARAEGDRADDGKKLVAMYSTHSDESYIPGDGTASKWKGAGIYDVGDSLKKALEERGIKAVYSQETVLPHDADAYNRSRRTAEELLKQNPDALLDIHRDAVPAEEYDAEVDGEDISKVRLFVGRSNPNASANKAFAQQLKKAADEQYPGLVKDIFIGKGGYNQDIYPHSLLLEFGSHETDKDKAIASTDYMASVLDSVLFGGGAKGSGASAGSAAKGIGRVIGLAVIAAIVYAVASTGSLKGAGAKLRRHASELTGGLIGKKEDDRKG